jgi:hypothetical protein
LFRAQRLEAGINFSARGCETSYIAYRTAFRRSRATRELGWNTTNGQRATAMDKAGRARCARTMQRHHALLGELGLLMTRHVHRGRNRSGFRDCVHLRLVQSFDIPPTAGGPSPTGKGAPPPKTASATADCVGRDHPPPLRDGVGNDEETAIEEELSPWGARLLRKMGISPEEAARAG